MGSPGPGTEASGLVSITRGSLLILAWGCGLCTQKKLGGRRHHLTGIPLRVHAGQEAWAQEEAQN